MQQATTTSLEIVPSSGSLGAEVRGVDLALPLDDATVAVIDAAWREHLVLVLRDQHIDDDQLIAFSRRFGELDPPGPNPYSGAPIYPEYPELNVISNIRQGDKPVGNLGSGEAVWHADMTYNDIPPAGAILYAVELPADGGNTEFADMRLAYDTLPYHLKDQICGRRAIHDASHNSAGIRRRGYAEVTDVRHTPGARQPLVRTDPVTGRRSLFLGRRPRSYIVGLELDDSEALLDALWAHAGRREGVFTHRWKLGDVLMWDNLSVLHRRDAFESTDRRRLHRAQLKGTGPIA
ncbi:MAG: TauD/TfdA family dioxygenase [Pseudomonadota bacterium]